MKLLDFIVVGLTGVSALDATVHHLSSGVRGAAAFALEKGGVRKGTTTGRALVTTARVFATEGTGKARPELSNDGYRVQHRELAEENVLRSAWAAHDTQEPGECEVAALAVSRLRTVDIAVATDGLQVTFGAWSVSHADTFDDGDACGDVSDRATSIAAFDSAFARLDGAGFGNLMFYQVNYQIAASDGVDTKIHSSLVSAQVVTSLGGNTVDVTIGAVSYGGPYFLANVNFASSAGTPYSLPLLFYTPSLCQRADITLDFYGVAALGYGSEIGGSIGYFTSLNETGTALDARNVFSAIVLADDDALNSYLVNQLICDVLESPVYGPAAWAECSAGTQYVNTSVLVGGCEVLVSPARWVVVGNFFNETFMARSDLWIEQFSPQQFDTAEAGLQASQARRTATTGLAQATTQVGLELDSANDYTEWVLVLIVAVEALVVVAALAVSSLYSRRRGEDDNVAVACGKLVLALVLLCLSLIPLYVARESESNAANMAHNDVYGYTSDKTACFSAVWEGVSVFESWCLTRRVASESLMVRSYSKTLFRDYNELWWVTVILGCMVYVAYVVISTWSGVGSKVWTWRRTVVGNTGTASGVSEFRP